ncbi:MAG: kelch repeat-containing protein [Planctomycetales bacterium]
MRRAFLVPSCFVLCCGLAASAGAAELPANQWVELDRHAEGGRRACAIRYAPGVDRFFLWGFLNADRDLLQENHVMEMPEHDMVAFDPQARKWENRYPAGWAEKWGGKPPRAIYARSYSGITSGSEQSRFQSPPDFPDAPPRPDMNLVFDQVGYRPKDKSLFYFFGGLTLSFDTEKNTWTNLEPKHSPPPVTCGAICYDPVNNAMILFGGGHVAEKAPDGKLVGYTGTWAYSFADKDWKRLATEEGPSSAHPIDETIVDAPPPRMNSPLVCDEKHGVLVLFGGDSQSHYFADTFLFDLKTRQWRHARATNNPPPRAGHFTVYDPQSGWVIIGGGYNRKDLSDMWAYSVKEDRWRKLAGTVPTGFTISADIAPEQRLIVLTANTKRPGDGSRCNELYPVRTTYGYRLDEKTAVTGDAAETHAAMSRRPPEERNQPYRPDPERARRHAERLKNLPVNRWTLLDEPSFAAPARTWGSATFDTDRGRILSWGGGHCGYGGSDVDEFDIAQHTWVGSKNAPEFLERAWNLGVREAGVTFQGAPWAEHGRTVFAYDLVLKKLLCVRPIRLTTGYDPPALAHLPADRRPREGAKVVPPTSYNRFGTFAWDPETTEWELIGPGVVGLDRLVSTPRGVMGVNVDWPARLLDTGHEIPWTPESPPVDNTVFHFDAETKKWKRLGEKQTSPQNLYEYTSLAYDAKRDRVLLHGAGRNNEELWSFDVKAGKWTHLEPKVHNPNEAPPRTGREMIYLPDDDMFLTYGRGGRQSRYALWAYLPAENVWGRLNIEPPQGISPNSVTGPTRAMLYDPARKLVFLVLSRDGNLGRSIVYAMRFAREKTAFILDDF